MIQASLIAQLVKNCQQCKRPQFDSWVRKICWRRDKLPTLVFLGFPCGSAGKESTCNMGHLGSIPGLGRSPGEGKGYPLQYSGLENFTDCIVHGVAKSWKQVSDFQFQYKKYTSMKVTHLMKERSMLPGEHMIGRCDLDRTIRQAF